NSRLAPFVAAAPLAKGGLRAIWAKMGPLFHARRNPFRRTVAVHLLVLGAVVFIWLNAYEYRNAEGLNVLTATQFKVNGECVLNFTPETQWPIAIAEATRKTIPYALGLVFQAIVLALGTLFMAGYGVIGLEAEDTGAPSDVIPTS